MQKLTICGAPVSDFSLVLRKEPHPAERTAAEFLQTVLEKACGVLLPVTEDAEGPGIFLGTRSGGEGVRWDGFRIRTDDRNLYLDGNVPRGTLYAAVDFAERYLRYRFFASDTEVIPTEGEAEIPAFLDRCDNPSFQERHCDHSPFLENPRFRVFSRIWEKGGATPEELGGPNGSYGGCHTFSSLCPSGLYYRDHPEYYALAGGQRIPCGDHSKNGPGQLCLSNPDVLRIVTDAVLDQLRKNPSLKTVDVSQEDNENYCRCPACAAIDEEEGAPSGSIIRFVNAVAEAVEKEFPHVLVRTFAYQYSARPPKKTRARHNVLIRYCTIHGCFRHGFDDPACSFNRETVCREMREWGSVCDQMSVWDYVTNWDCFLTPFPNLISLRENVRFFRSCGVVSVFEEDNPWKNEGGMHHELAGYLIGKLLWNADMTEEEYSRHIDEFLEAFYGPGWREIRRIIELEHETTDDRVFRCFEEIDLSMIHFQPTPFLPGYKRFRNFHYRPAPYQPVLPGHPLTGFSACAAEVDERFDRAEEAAETDLQREHIRRARFSFDYLKLFCAEHDREKMSPQERTEYESRARQWIRDRETLDLDFNLNTAYTRIREEADLQANVR
ncbi:MAG: DUF4838 domain-containing protein [Clostridia bacterium]|nr:DUF4838 domain-containing protein [Clostridia bacterium]